MYRHWTTAEDRLFRKYGNKEIAKRTGRPITSVQSRKQVLRRAGAVFHYLRKVRRATWTSAKDKIVAENPPSVAMRLLDYARDTIKLRRKALGLGPWAYPRKIKKPARPRPPRGTAKEDRRVLSVSLDEAVRQSAAAQGWPFTGGGRSRDAQASACSGMGE